MASTQAQLDRAFAKYGASVDAIAGRYVNPVTGQRLSGKALLAKLVKGESGNQGDRTSSAGAKGFAQFMPGSRAASISKYGVDPWAGPDQAVHAASLHLRGHINGSTGLEGYNPGGGQDYVNYILGQRVGQVAGGGGAAPAASVGGPQASASGFSPGPVQGSLAEKLAPQPQAQVSLPAAPSFAAQAVMPAGYTPIPTGGVSAPSQPVAEPVAQGQSLPRVSAKAASVAGGGSAPAAASGHGSGNYPLARRGKIIGTPGAGTHTLGNWQSDNAVDIAVPVGTPIYAREDGVIAKVRSHPQGGGRFAGDQITLTGTNNSYFYAHGTTLVKAGDRVKKGQIIGRSGSANGVAHLHYAIEHGNPLGKSR